MIFFWQRGCVILFVESLRDFVCGEFAWFFCLFVEVAWFFVCGKVAWFFLCSGCVLFLWRGWMIFLWRSCVIFSKKGCVTLCMERLHDFCVWRGCVSFLTHSIAQVAWFIFFWRLHNFFCGEVYYFLLRYCVIFSVRLIDFPCEEVAWFLCEEVFFSKKKVFWWKQFFCLWKRFFVKKVF